MHTTIQQLLHALGGTYTAPDGDLPSDISIQAIAPLESAPAGSISFIARPQFLQQLGSCQASCLIVSEALQKLTGGHLRHILGAMTTNRFTGLLTGASYSLPLQQIVSLEEDEYHLVDPNKSFNIENERNNYRNQLKDQNVLDVNNKEYNYQTGDHYMDIISECEKLGDYVVNVVEARTDIKEKKI